MTTWDRYMRFLRALASSDALRLIVSAPDPIAAHLEAISPFVVTDRLREQERPRTLLSGPRR